MGIISTIRKEKPFFNLNLPSPQPYRCPDKYTYIFLNKGKSFFFFFLKNLSRTAALLFIPSHRGFEYISILLLKPIDSRN